MLKGKAAIMAGIDQFAVHGWGVGKNPKPAKGIDLFIFPADGGGHGLATTAYAGDCVAAAIAGPTPGGGGWTGCLTMPGWPGTLHMTPVSSIPAHARIA